MTVIPIERLLFNKLFPQLNALPSFDPNFLKLRNPPPPFPYSDSAVCPRLPYNIFAQCTEFSLGLC